MLPTAYTYTHPSQEKKGRASYTINGAVNLGVPFSKIRLTLSVSASCCGKWAPLPARPGWESLSGHAIRSIIPNLAEPQLLHL